MTDDEIEKLADDTMAIGAKWQSIGVLTEGYMIGSIIRCAVLMSMKDATDNGGRLRRLIESVGKIAAMELGVEIPNAVPSTQPSVN